MLTYLTANTTIELICLLFAIVCLIKDESLVWRSLILYLLVTCIIEISAIYFARKTHNNQWEYNIFLVFEVGFTNLMFAYLFNRYREGRFLIITGLALFFVLYVYELVEHGFSVYNNLTYTVMSVLYVLYSLYFYFLLIKDERYVYLRHSAPFWWVAGVLFFYFSNTACNLFDKQLEHVMITPTQNLNYFIFKALNVILYGCWSYSFICRKWLTTTSKA